MKKILVIMILVLAAGSVYARDDMEYDLYLELDKKLNDQFTLMYASENWGEKEIAGGANYFGFYYKPTSWFSVNPFVNYGVRIPNYHDYEEIMPGFNLFFTGEVYQGWKLDWRSQHVIRCIKGEDHPFYRTRNRFRLLSPWKWTRFEINPRWMIVESWFHTKEDWEGHSRFFTWRSAVMVAAKLSDNLSTSAWFLKQWVRNNDDRGTYNGNWQFGMAFIYSF